VLGSGFGASFPALVLPGRTLHLRPPRPQDFDEWAALRDVSRAYLEPWEPTWPADALTRAAFTRRLKRQANEWHADTGYAFLLFTRSGNGRAERLVGGLNLSNVRRGVAQMATIGYWTGQPFAGRGFMTEAVELIVAFAFEQLHLHRVEAACIPTNIASRRVLEKAGLVQEGLAPRYLRIDGEWQDHLLFGIDAESWAISRR
jgi:[ribosomal protein S5]-alanine N-acetyltransferase